MRCYCRILHISYKDHVTNEEVRAKIQQEIDPHEDLLMTVKRHKLQRYGHVSRSSSLAKTILQGTVKGGRRQGGQRKRWEDNIREWTGLVISASPRGITFTWWGCYGLCLWRKPTELAHSFLFCSCISICLCGPFNCISFHKFSLQLSAFLLCSSGLISALLVLSTVYLFMKVSFSPDIILIVGDRAQNTN